MEIAFRAHSALPRLVRRCAASTLPCRVLSPAAWLPAAADPSHYPVFDLLRRPTRPTSAIAVVSAEVNRASPRWPAARSSPSWCRSPSPLTDAAVLPAAVRRLGAARRRSQQLWRSGARRLSSGGSGAPPARSPAAFPGRAARLFGWLPCAVCAKKSCQLPVDLCVPVCSVDMSVA